MKLYGHNSIEKCDTIVALGGDRFLLKMIHDFKDFNKPIYVMNFGSVGFLMNSTKEKNLEDLINNSKSTELRPLKMVAKDNTDNN